MGKILIIGEKREAMVDMSKHLGEKLINKNGYLEGNKYIVSWAMGHLYVLETPERVNPDYGLWSFLTDKEKYKLKELINAPLVPDNDPTRYDKKYQKDQYEFSKAKGKQLKVLSDLLKRKDLEEIIYASDADAEGERIAQDIVRQQIKNFPHLKNVKQTRFWNTGSFKAKTAIEKALKERKPIQDDKYQNLYDSAKARLLSDYIVGMKLTKSLSEKYKTMISAGRIQSVLLAILRRREDDIKNFKPKEYWTLKGIYKELPFNHYYIEEDIDNDGKPKKVEKTSYMIKEDLDKVIEDCKKVDLEGEVIKFEEKTTKSSRPKLMSTGDFQSVYMDKFGGTLDMADLVLEYLRDEGYTTYPRTDGHYFSVADKEEVKDAYDTIKKVYGVNSEELKGLKDFNTKNPIFDDKKAAKQNHTPLSVTKKVPTEKTFQQWENATYKGKKLKKVKDSYFYILNMLAIQFLPDDVVKTQKIEIEVNSHKFKKDGRKIVEPGWRKLVNNFYKDTTIDLKLKKGDKIKLDELKVESSFTTKPPRYNKKSLLKTMINVNKALDEEISTIDDPEFRKKRIKEIQKAKKIFKEIEGIGTNATRKSILQILEKRGYIEVKGKKEDIYVTQKGYFVDDRNPQMVRSLDTTALWEEQLDLIRQGKKTYMDFVKGVDKEVMENMIPDIWDQEDADFTSNGIVSSLGKCPCCENGTVKEGKKAYNCSNWNNEEKPCKFTIWKNAVSKLGKKTITSNDVKKLLKDGKVKINLKSKTGNKYTKDLIIDKENCTVKVDFETSTTNNSNKEPIGKCPICNDGNIIEGSKAFSCSNWNNKEKPCKFTIWKNALDKFGGKVTKTLVKNIITKKEDKVKLNKGEKKVVLDEKYGLKVEF